MKSITPVISVILLVLLTIVASGAAFVFINSSVSELENQGSADTFPGADSSRLNLVSITGTKAIIRNDGSSPVTEIVMFVNGEMLNYTLDEPLMPGDLKEINYTARGAGEDLEIKIIYNNGKTTQGISPASKNTLASGFNSSFLSSSQECSIDDAIVNFDNNYFFGENDNLRCGCDSSYLINGISNSDFEDGETGWQFEGSSIVFKDGSNVVHINGNQDNGGSGFTTELDNILSSIDFSALITSNSSSERITYLFYGLGGENLDDYSMIYILDNGPNLLFTCDSEMEEGMYINCLNNMTNKGFSFDLWNNYAINLTHDIEIVWPEVDFSDYSEVTMGFSSFFEGEGDWRGELYLDNIISLSEITAEGFVCDSNGNNITDGICDNNICVTQNLRDNNFFTTVWNTSKTHDLWGSYIEGSSNSSQISLPLVSSGIYDFTVFWGDGSYDTINLWNQAEKTHTYSVEGDYEVNINGTLYGWKFEYESDRIKLKEIKNWGALRLGNTGAYFKQCNNLIITANDTLILDGTKNMKDMFQECNLLTNIPKINTWDVSKVTSMENMFYSISNFAGNISTWDTSRVTTMEGMFSGGWYFNQDISKWNTSSVTTLRDMFIRVGEYGTFDQNLSAWDVSKVTDMYGMFWGSHFTGDISGWDTSNVQTMSQMFWGSTFNGDISGWDVSNVEDMDYMFYQASNFNSNINEWDTSNVKSMYSIFRGASDFNQPLDNWDVSSITSMSNMFQDTNFNQSINNWNISNVNNFGSMFYNNPSFNQPLNNWDTSNATSMFNMFKGASSFNQDISMWDVSNVESMNYMFLEASSFNQPIGLWDVSNVTTMNMMFAMASSFNQSINDWDVSKVNNMGGMFYSASDFNQPLDNWDVSSVTDMGSMFYYASDFNQNISGWDVSKVTDMGIMFSQVHNFNWPIGLWNVSSVTDMGDMFWGATNFNQDISGWDVSKVTNMYQMFVFASNFNQPIGSWNTSSVTTMYRMFYWAPSFDQDISGWDVSKVNNMEEMFSYGHVISNANYDNMLNAWSLLPVQSGVTFNAGYSEYCSAGTAREYLINTKGWSIADGGLKTGCP